MDNIYKTHKPSSGGSDFLKLKDGDKARIRIASEPVGTIYKEGDKLRYAWVVWNRDTKTAQVFTSGVSIFSQIADIVEDWAEDPKDFDITIKRTGSGQTDTSYSVTPVKKSDDLTEDERKHCEAIDLLKVTRGRWLSEIEEDGQLPTPTSDELPIRDDVFPTDDDAPINLDDVGF
jgi:hypothetical protein